jgi:hypothetical protein
LSSLLPRSCCSEEEGDVGLMDAVVEAAARNRIEVAQDERIDQAIMTLLARFEAVTADRQKMSYLRFLLKHYAASPHPWTACFHDNFKRFGPKTRGLCGVLKDTLRGRTDWRHGPPAGSHPGHPDAGTPGVGIAYADVPGTKQWPYGHIAKLDIPEEYADVADEVHAVLLDIADNCNPCRVLLGLDPAPSPSETFLTEYVEAATV